MASRVEVLKASLAKKTALFDEKLMAHMGDVRSANGQPLNDKRNGAATLGKWERQNDSLRALNASIEKTKSAIEREETKSATADSVALPEPIKALIGSGVLTQWRKHPRFFFVAGVEKARITLMDNGQVGHRHLSSIPSQEQYATFRDVFNSLRAQIAAQPTTKE